MASSRNFMYGDDEDATASDQEQQQSQQPSTPTLGTFANGAPIAPKGYVHLMGWRLVVIEIWYVLNPANYARANLSNVSVLASSSA